MCIGRLMALEPAVSARLRSAGPRSTVIVVTNATASAQANVTTTARAMRRVLLVRGWWRMWRSLRKFKIQNSKCKMHSKSVFPFEFRILHFELLQHYQYGTCFNRRPLDSAHFRDSPRGAGPELVFHLHRLDNDHSLTRLDAVPRFDEQLHNLSRHRRRDSLRPIVASARPEPSRGARPEPSRGARPERSR